MLDMEKSDLYSEWADEEYQAAVKKNKDYSSFVVPWPSCGDGEASISSQCVGLGYDHHHHHLDHDPSCSWSNMPFGVVEAKEDGAASASKSHSHSQAEKRRRDRINAQLATLRKLIPKSDKMDKAALLGSVVEHVKDLKRKAMEVSKVLTVPTDVDEVTIDCYFDQETTISPNMSKENILIKASVCCDDRPELLAELNQALRGLKLTTVRADMASLGGRIKSIFVLCSKDGKEGVCMKGVIQSLKGVLSRIASSTSTGGSSYRIKSKRQRFFLPSSHY